MNRNEINAMSAETNTYAFPFDELVRETPKAVLLDVGFQVWVPKSIIRMAPCADDLPYKNVAFVPMWFARKNGLTAKPRSTMAY